MRRSKASEILLADALTAQYDGFLDPATHGFPVRFQKELTEICAAIYGVLLRGGGDAVDLGANHGFHTLRMAKSLGDAPGRVVAVEANQALAKRLQSLTANDPRVLVLYKAIVPMPQPTVSFTTSSKYLALGSIVPDYIKNRFPKLYDDAGLETQVVEAVTIDQLLQEQRLDKLRFLKCDVEGMDFEVMSATEHLWSTRAGLCVEMNFGPKSRVFSERLLAKLTAHGYSVYDCFMNMLDAQTWFEPRRCPIDRFLLPQETPAAMLAAIKAAVAKRWNIYQAKPAA